MNYKYIALSNSLFINYIQNDNNNIITKLKKLLFIYNRRNINLKYKFFYKYYYIINKIKVELYNPSYLKCGKKMDKNKIIITNIEKNKSKRSIIKEQRNISNESKKYDAHFFRINNVYNKFNFYNPFSVEIQTKSNEPKAIKKNASCYHENNSNYLSNFIQEKIKKNNYLYFMHKHNNSNLINSPILTINKVEKIGTQKNNNCYDNISDNNNIIINYINEMEEYNKLNKKQNNANKKAPSSKKNHNNLYKYRKINSCFNIPSLFNIIPNTKISIPYTNLNYNKTIDKCYSEENNLIFSKDKDNYKNSQYSKTSRNDNKYKNTMGSRNKENKMEILINDFEKINVKTNENIIFKQKIRGIKNDINKDIFNKINSSSNSFKSKGGPICAYKKEKAKKKNYYQNNSLNYYRHNSFLSKTILSTKKNIDSNTKSKGKTSKNNSLFSPVLINRVNSNRLNILQKSNRTNNTNNKIKNNLTNYKNKKNYIKNNLFDFSNSLSTNYKEKMSNKDIEDSGTNLCFKNSNNRNNNIMKINSVYNKNKNNLFNRNQKIQNTDKTYNNAQKINNSLNYLADINIKRGNNDKKSLNNYNIPLSSIKKTNNHILQNISFSNNSAEKQMNDNKIIKKINSATNNNNKNYINLNKKFKQYDNLKIASIISLKEEKDNKLNNNKNENMSKDYYCMNIINECFEKKNIEENKDEKNYQNEKVETSFESLSDSKLYELAKSYIPKEDYFDRNEMEHLLKNRKGILNK